MGARSRKEKELMKCVVCRHGGKLPSNTTVTFERGGGTLVVKSVRASI
jgi:YgiT-type zinc finger domain-containing protein